MRQLCNSLYIAAHYLKYHWSRSAVLIVSLAVILFVPLALNLLMNETRTGLTARADQTPLILGSVGSAVDLAMTSLYFHETIQNKISMSDLSIIDESGHGYTIPLNTKYRAGEYPVVGTTLDYFDFRDLKIALRTAWLNPLTGGLLSVSTATSPRRSLMTASMSSGLPCRERIGCTIDRRRQRRGPSMRRDFGRRIRSRRSTGPVRSSPASRPIASAPPPGADVAGVAVDRRRLPGGAVRDQAVRVLVQAEADEPGPSELVCFVP